MMEWVDISDLESLEEIRISSSLISGIFSPIKTYYDGVYMVSNRKPLSFINFKKLKS